MAARDGGIAGVGRDRTTGVAATVIAAAVAVHVAAVLMLPASIGFWWDEYFSLWASDPQLPLATVLSERILPDSNPPLYFTLLSLVRRTGLGDLASILVLNGAALVAAVAVVAADGVRTGRAPQAAAAVAGTLVSGPVLAFAAEGRAYPVALAEVLVAAWFAARSVTGDRRPAPIAGMALLGVLAGLTHVYAAIACGALAAGAVIAGSRRTAVPMLVLGATAAIVTVAWAALNWGASDLIDWIRFDWFAFRHAIGESTHLILGHVALAAAVVGVIAMMAATPGLGRAATAFAVAVALFVAIPTAASFVKPILTPRYLLVIGPAVPVFLAAPWSPAIANPRLRAIAALVLTAVALAGIPAADRFLAEKSVWRGGPIVADLGRDCSPGSIAVNGPAKASQDPAWLSALAKASGLPSDRFVIAGRSATARADCPVLGWAEHVYGPELPTDRVLRMLGIERAPDGVEVRRTPFGYVVLDKPG